jgi:hypothetical protein
MMQGAEWDTGKYADAAAIWKEFLERDKDEDWLTAHKVAGFRCTDCKTPVYFVRGGLSFNGRNPHFKVSHKTPHKLPSCPPKPKSAGVKAQASGTVHKPGVLGAGGVKVINYRKQSPLVQTGSGTGGGSTGAVVPGGRKPATKYVASNGTPNQEESTFLDSHLSFLRNTTNYPGADLRLKVTGRGEVYAKDYFCNLEAATDQLAAQIHDGKAPLMAYWGRIDWANKASGKASTLFLNSEGIRTGQGGMAIMLPPATATKYLSELGLTDPKTLEKHWVIAEGRLEMTRTGSRLLRVEDTTRIVVQAP